MNRRIRYDDGTSIVWRRHDVTLYDADGDPVESRPLTDIERVEFEAWQDAQPDAAYVRATREAHATVVAAERAAAEKLATVRTLPELVAALVAQRTRGTT